MRQIKVRIAASAYFQTQRDVADARKELFNDANANVPTRDPTDHLSPTYRLRARKRCLQP